MSDQAAMETAGIEFGTASLEGASIGVVDTSNFKAPYAVIPPSADMSSVRESLGPLDLTAALAVLDGSDPAQWRGAAENYISSERGAFHQTDLWVEAAGSRLHVRAFGGNGYYNEFPGPFYEAVLDDQVRLSEDQARQLYKRADERMKEFSGSFNPEAQERARRVFDGLPQSIAGAEFRRITPEERNRSVIWRSGPQRPEYDYFKAMVGDVEILVTKDHQLQPKWFGLRMVDGASFKVSIVAASKSTDIYWGVTGFGNIAGGLHGKPAEDIYRQIEAGQSQK